MKKSFLLMLLSLAIIGLSFFAFPLKKVNADTVINAPDYYAIGSKTTFTQDSSGVTRATMGDSTLESRFIYGDETNDYKIDLTHLTLKLKVDEIEKAGRFTISFVGTRDSKPMVEGAEGISFVFRSTQDGSVEEIAILDSKTGGLIAEMEGAKWAYLGDASTNWNNGVIGYIGGENGQIKGSEFLLKFASDSASAGGTTFRPSIGSGSLGVSIPLTIFTSRSLDIKSLVMMISTGEGNTNYNFVDGSQSKTDSGSDLVMSLESLVEPNTTKYFNGTVRSELLDKISTYKTQIDSLLKAELDVQSYSALLSATFDLSVLRNHDHAIQEANLNKAKAILDDCEAKITSLVTLSSTYYEKNEVLKDLSKVTSVSTEEAVNAKAAYEAAQVYLKYLSEADQATVNSNIAKINKTYITRAEANLALTAFENTVDVYKTNPSAAQVDDIIASSNKKDAIDTSVYASLDEADKNSFTSRYNAALSTYNEALNANLYQVNIKKIDNYDASALALTDTSIIDDFKNTIALRPTLDTASLSESDRTAVNDAFSKADADFKKAINSRIKAILDPYSGKVAVLDDRYGITEDKISAAIALKYDQDFINAMVVIANTISLDLSSSINSLKDCDRKIEVAYLFLDLRVYSKAITAVGAPSALDSAYQYRSKCLDNQSSSLLNTTEKAEYDEIFTDTDTAMNNKALSYISPKMTALEKAVDEDLKEAVNMSFAKTALAAIPSLSYLTVSTDIESYTNRYNEAKAKMMVEDLYYFTASSGSSWSAESKDNGVLLSGLNNEGIMCLQETLDINTLDLVFDYTKIGRIWAGAVDGKYPQNILVVNFMRDYGTIKDQSQGFSIYINPNNINQLEVTIYGADREGTNIMLAQGTLDNCIFTDPNTPYQIRIRISKQSSPLNCYQVWVNSLKLNVYYRDFVNFDSDSALHVDGFDDGSEIGEHLYKNDQCYVAFVLFGQDLTEEERRSSITIKMLSSKTFGGYVAPLLPIEMTIEKEPAKLTYEKGETIDLTGLVITIKMSDGTDKTIDNSLLTISGFNTTSTGNKIVSLIYTENGISLTKVIKISVVEKPDNGGETPSKTGLIIGISCGSFVLLAGLAVGLYFIIRKKKHASLK